MTPEEIASLEKEYLINVLGKNLIDSKERDDRKNPPGYRVLAMKYWPKEFEKAKKEGYRLIIHHIDFDRTNNVLSNLVVLTYSEHKTIHYMFDTKFKETKKKISKSNKGKPKGPMSDEQKNKLSELNKGKTHTEETKKKISESLKRRKR